MFQIMKLHIWQCQCHHFSHHGHGFDIMKNPWLTLLSYMENGECHVPIRLCVMLHTHASAFWKTICIPCSGRCTSRRAKACWMWAIQRQRSLSFENARELTPPMLHCTSTLPLLNARWATFIMPWVLCLNWDLNVCFPWSATIWWALIGLTEADGSDCPTAIVYSSAQQMHLQTNNRCASEWLCQMNLTAMMKMQFGNATSAWVLEPQKLDTYWWKHEALRGLGNIKTALGELQKAFAIPYKSKNYKQLLRMRQVGASPLDLWQGALVDA